MREKYYFMAKKIELILAYKLKRMEPKHFEPYQKAAISCKKVTPNKKATYVFIDHAFVFNWTNILCKSEVASYMSLAVSIEAKIFK